MKGYRVPSSLIDKIEREALHIGDFSYTDGMNKVIDAIKDLGEVELDNPWHTGTPTEEGWYLIKYECIVECRHKGKLSYRAVHIYYDRYGIYNEDGSIGHDEVWKPIEYQIIEQNKETD